jgi:glycosyltransferase involved in cell wall biosynthesis
MTKLENNGSRPVRVLLTVPHLNRKAAPFRHMMNLARYLPKDEFDLTICSISQKGYKETAPRLTELGRRCLVARFRPTGLSLREVLASLRAQARIDKLGPFDIQHSIMGTSSPYEAFLSRIKSRFHVHSQIDMTDGGHPLLFRWKLQLARRIIAVSESVAEYVRSNGAAPKNVRTVYNGIDIEEIDQLVSLKRPKQGGLILCVGLVIPRKRCEDAIRAVSILSKEIPNIRLGIAGRIAEPAYYRELQQLINDLSMGSRVEFLGVRGDIPELMQQAEALIHCADSEGFGWVVVEAMTVGIPVVGSEIGPLKELLQEGRAGVIVPVGDAQGYANALKRVMQQPDFSRKLIQTARSAVEQKFSAKAMVGKIADVYRELTPPHNPQQ